MTRPVAGKENGIGTLRERSLHAELKLRLARPGDRFEIRVGEYIVDILRDGEIVEIQTGGFSTLKRKLADLTAAHPVTLVHPIAARRWITTISRNGSRLARRRSPKRGSTAEIFAELVSIPEIVLAPGFSLVVLLIEEEEVRRTDGKGSWRHGRRSIVDRELISILDSVTFRSPTDFRSFLPDVLPEPFTSRELAERTGHPLYLAQKMTYCLRKMNVIRPCAMRKNAILYSRVAA